MRSILKFGCIGLLLLVAVAVILGIIADKEDGPRQSFQFLNTSGEKRSVTFELKVDTGYEDIYTINKEVEAGKWVIDRVPAGTYQVKVWNSEDKLVERLKDVTVTLENEESNYHLIRLDLGLDKNFAVLNLNFLYEGNSFAEHMSEAMGTRQSDMKIEKLYAGNQPFLVSQAYSNREFILWDEDIPSEVSYGAVVYGLFPYPKDLEKTEIVAYLKNSLQEKFE